MRARCRRRKTRQTFTGSPPQSSSGATRREVLPVEVTESCLAQIERHEKSLVRHGHGRPEEALAAARSKRWTKGEPQGPVDGVPTTVKDILLVRGWPTLRGSRTVDKNQPWDGTRRASAACVNAGRCSWGAPPHLSSAGRA